MRLNSKAKLTVKQRTNKIIPLTLYLIILVCSLCLTMLSQPTANSQPPHLNQKALQKIGKKYGPAVQARVTDWKKLIANNKSLPTQAKLKLVNDFFNQLTFRSDQALIGQSDYWQTPLEFLINGVGDCEDFSIAKYFTLRYLGIPDSKLKITYVKATLLNQAHMVLAYYPTPDADPLILDNLITSIKPASERPDLIPVYSFNGSGLWLAKQRGLGQYVSGPERIGPWYNVLKRMTKEVNEN